MELAKTFLQRCPQVKVTVNPKYADYVVGLNHQAFHGIIHKNNQIMVARRDGEVISSTVARSVGRNVTDACAVILADWKTGSHNDHLTADPVTTPVQSPAQEAPQQEPMQTPSTIQRDRCVDDSGNVIC